MTGSDTLSQSSPRNSALAVPPQAPTSPNEFPILSHHISHSTARQLIPPQLIISTQSHGAGFYFTAQISKNAQLEMYHQALSPDFHIHVDCHEELRSTLDPPSHHPI